MSELQYIQSAFAEDTNLCDRVLAAAQQNKEQLQLFIDVARYLSRKTGTNGTNGDITSTKKRKLDQLESTSTSTFDPSTLTPSLSVPETSFSIPVRKKLSLSLFSSDQNSEGGGLHITGKDTSYTIPYSAIEHIFVLPVPEKATKQHHFVILLSTPVNGEKQFVCSLAETGYTGTSEVKVEGDTWVSITGRVINTALAAVGKGIVLPDEGEFKSVVPQAGRKGEAAGWVKGFLGSKDGYLFFLPTGLLFGFKKPILFFPFSSIESISYTSVLQRTFNLVLTTQDVENETKEIEFAMLDQVDFAGIDEYIKRHGLNDASMAKERMAKRVGVNDPRRKKGEEVKEEEETNGVVEEESELARAERELQDEEDEEEEDYDPGSEGESEGEGSDTGDEGDGGEIEEVGEDEVDGEEDEE